ncbi:ATP-binding protein [Methylobacterium sp. 37f]|uniref:sensor histidine kinase n=1 Tax=Methylobacterium sp. 37f TaxID=2817058 RepID=UPI001FFD3636|nr:ATP-binding protein [Methylobacterium sp. 37f]MCK2052845.1 PAS domain S-box protein [Methylobacterium sp. 37f]
MADPSTATLILDASGARVLHASAGTDPLLRAISDADGRIYPDLRLGEQIARARLRRDHPVLVRLHLDPRRLAPPVTVSLLLTALAEDGEAVVLVAGAPLPNLRPRRAAESRAEPPPPSAAIPPVPDAIEIADQDPNPKPNPDLEGDDPLVLRQRFTWESDAGGAIVRISQEAGSAFRRRFQGRTWRDLAQAEILRDAGGLLTALEGARTFRAIPVTLIEPDGALCELELSGAPIDRSGNGFRGFGQVRSIVRPAVSVASAPPAAPAMLIPVSAPVLAPVPTPVPAPAEAEEALGAVLPPDSGPVETPLPEPDPHLSSHEHAAFREIARALGARFAGDDRAEPESEPGLPCAVMPFPVPPARPVDPAAPDAAMVATLERIPSGVLVYRDNAVLFANRPLLDLVGYADRDALAAAGGVGHLFGGLDPHARSSVDTPLVLVTRDGGRASVLVEHSVLDWAGQPAELLLARDAEPSEEARAATAVAIAQDFAARRGADALAVLETLEDGVALLDERGRILTLNRRTAEAFGLDSREVVGASFLSLFAAEHAVALLARLHADPASAAMDEIPVTARGTGVRLRVKILPLAGDAQGRLCAVIRNDGSHPEKGGSDIRDEASRARASEAGSVRQADVLAWISQSVQAPITSMMGLTDGLLDATFGPPDSERHRAALQEIRASGTHLLDLINDLLDLARIEAGRLDLDIAEVPLNDVVSRCVALLQPQAARERIVLRTSFSVDLPPLLADERSVHQATLNVLAHAIALTEAGGQVIVSTTMADRGEIALRVRDTGAGMTPDEVDGVLNPFRQELPPREGLPSSESLPSREGLQADTRRGTGLGLPLTKALVEANQGRFRIDSRKHEGTLVEMSFPARPATMRA